MPTQGHPESFREKGFGEKILSGFEPGKVLKNEDPDVNETCKNFSPKTLPAPDSYRGWLWRLPKR